MPVEPPSPQERLRAIVPRNATAPRRSVVRLRSGDVANRHIRITPSVRGRRYARHNARLMSSSYAGHGQAVADAEERLDRARPPGAQPELRAEVRHVVLEERRRVFIVIPPAVL